MEGEAVEGYKKTNSLIRPMESSWQQTSTRLSWYSVNSLHGDGATITWSLVTGRPSVFLSESTNMDEQYVPLVTNTNGILFFHKACMASTVHSNGFPPCRTTPSMSINTPGFQPHSLIERGSLIELEWLIFRMRIFSKQTCAIPMCVCVWFSFLFLSIWVFVFFSLSTICTMVFENRSEALNRDIKPHALSLWSDDCFEQPKIRTR